MPPSTPRPPRHPHQRALVLTARKLVRLIDALLRSQALYQPPGSARPNPTQRRTASGPTASVITAAPMPSPERLTTPS